MLHDITRIRNRRTDRISSWDTTGRNDDRWTFKPGETRTIAQIDGPAQITHLWFTQQANLRDVLLRVYYDGSKSPSVNVPLGDFFCLGHNIVTSFQSALFTASCNWKDTFNKGVALNSYAPMPFREHCRIELANEGKRDEIQYFYVDYETLEPGEVDDDCGYFHAEFRRTNPFGGWGPEITVNAPETKAACKEKWAYDNNYVILETKGRGHYIGCNISVTCFEPWWWGEGDDMIWVDGYKWPPDLHGTGSEDYLNQAWGMQDNAFMRNGSSIYETNTLPRKPDGNPHRDRGGYQTSYVFHLENPVRFQKDIKVTIEHGHANHLRNEMSSVGYWYADRPTKVAKPPSVAKRQPVLANNLGEFIFDKKNQCPGPEVPLTEEMKKLKRDFAKRMAEQKMR